MTLGVVYPPRGAQARPRGAPTAAETVTIGGSGWGSVTRTRTPRDVTEPYTLRASQLYTPGHIFIYIYIYIFIVILICIYIKLTGYVSYLRTKYLLP